MLFPFCHVSVLAAAVAGLLATPLEARGDWLITPFAGWTFAGQTLNLERSAGEAQLMFGAAGGWLSDGVLGFEGEFAYAPGYFEGDIVSGSYLYTLGGNVIVTLPLTLTRESLRPYAIGGLGVLDGDLQEIAGDLSLLPELTQFRASTAVSVGGGVIGFVSRNTAVRFDLRHVRSLDRDTSPVTGVIGTKLSFWRITAGVTFRR